jgi:hypothetical protein
MAKMDKGRRRLMPSGKADTMEQKGNIAEKWNEMQSAWVIDREK